MWAAVAAAAAALAAAPGGPRHVVVTVIDDLGFDDFGFANGGQIATPIFDGMHARGIGLTQYYVQPSCSPTRATILTGRMPVHTGINVWIPNAAYGLPLNETTFADVLNRRGFKSHAVGKWHLGCHRTAYLPTFRGFGSYYGYYEGSEDYWTHNFYGNGLDFHQEDSHNCSMKSGCSKLVWNVVENGECDRTGRCTAPEYWAYYSTHLFAARATSIIAAHAPADAPLFLYLAFQGVHEPRQAPAHYIDPYNDTIADPGRRAFAGMLAAVDEGVGNVSAALKQNGMYDDTLFIVTTDNGGPTTECSSTGQSNWPLRGSKCSIWEGGTRGAGFLFWAGLPPAAKGTRWDGLIHACDWLPTVVAATTGSEVQAGETLPLDGISMWDALTSAATSPRTEIYYGVKQDLGGPAVRDVAGNKLILADSGGGKGNWSAEQLPNTSSSPDPPRAMHVTQHDAEAAPQHEAAAPDFFSYAGAGSACKMQPQTCYPGSDLGTADAVDPGACCGLCSALPGCQGFSFQETAPRGKPNCFMKSLMRDGDVGGGCTSGFSSGYLHLPPPVGPLLYDVVVDPGERVVRDKTTPANAAAVAALQAIVARYARTKVPQATSDPSCPKFSGLNTTDPSGNPAKYIGPWCDGY